MLILKGASMNQPSPPPHAVPMYPQQPVVHCVGCRGCSWGKLDIFFVVSSLMAMVGIQLAGIALAIIMGIGGCVVSSDTGRDFQKGFVEGMKD